MDDLVKQAKALEASVVSQASGAKSQELLAILDQFHSVLAESSSAKVSMVDSNTQISRAVVKSEKQTAVDLLEGIPVESPGEGNAEKELNALLKASVCYEEDPDYKDDLACDYEEATPDAVSGLEEMMCLLCESALNGEGSDGLTTLPSAPESSASSSSSSSKHTYISWKDFSQHIKDSHCGLDESRITNNGYVLKDGQIFSNSGKLIKNSRTVVKQITSKKIAARSTYGRDELFIDSVRQHRVLYDAKDKNYKDTRTVKENAWRDVVANMHEGGFSEMDVTGAKERWKSIRDTFMANKRKLERAARSGAGTSAPPTWTLWPLLDFLQPHQEKQSTESNVSMAQSQSPISQPSTSQSSTSQPSTSQSSTSQPSTSQTSTSQTSTSQSSTSQPSTSQSSTPQCSSHSHSTLRPPQSPSPVSDSSLLSPSSSPVLKRRRKVSTIPDPLLEMVRTLGESVNARMQQDEHYYFAMQLPFILRKMAPGTAAFVKVKIMTMIAEQMVPSTHQQTFASPAQTSMSTENYFSDKLNN